MALGLPSVLRGLAADYAQCQLAIGLRRHQARLRKDKPGGGGGGGGGLDISSRSIAMHPDALVALDVPDES